MAEVSYRAVVRELAAGSEAPALRRLERCPIPPPEDELRFLKNYALGGPAVRIPFAPAESQQQTGARVGADSDRRRGPISE